MEFDMDAGARGWKLEQVAVDVRHTDEQTDQEVDNDAPNEDTEELHVFQCQRRAGEGSPDGMKNCGREAGPAELERPAINNQWNWHPEPSEERTPVRSKPSGPVIWSRQYISERHVASMHSMVQLFHQLSKKYCNCAS